MKTRLLLAASALTLLMPACSWMHHKSDFAGNSYNDGYDHAYMAAVERQAESTGTQIIWINPPQAKKSGTPQNK
jgi:hypothetical protein